MAEEKFTSLSGEKDTEVKTDGQHGWALGRAKASEDRIQVWKAKVGTNARQTYADYKKAKGNEAENDGKPVPWVSLDLTAFVAEDLQKAINQIKDVCDQVIAYAQAVSAVAKLVAAILAANASLIEAAINAIRNEIKSILDSLLGFGGAYALYIPGQIGGIDAYKKTFYDSLKDTKDASRPQIANTTTAHVIFLAWGSPWLDLFDGPFKKLMGFIFPASSFRNPGKGAGVPEPINVQVRTIYAPVIKSQLQDQLYKLADENQIGGEAVPVGSLGKKKQDKIAGGVESVLRAFEGYFAVLEKATALQAWVTWDVPENVDTFVTNEFRESNSQARELAFYNTTTYYTPAPAKLTKTVGPPSNYHDFIREDIRITHYVVARSNNADALGKITEEHPAVLQAIKTKSDVTSGHELGEKDAVFVGFMIPGFNSRSDTDIFDLSQPTTDAILSSIEAQTGDKAKAKQKILDFHYKVMFWGRKVVRKIRLVETGSADSSLLARLEAATTTNADTAAKTYDVFYSKAALAKENPTKPFDLDNPDDTVELEDVREALEWRFDYAKCEAYFEKQVSIDMADKSDPEWVHSNWSEDKTTTNDSLKLPGYGPQPNWYAAKGQDFIPIVKRLIERAKAFVDAVADALIESLNGLLAYVKSILDYVEHLTRKLIALMELIKSLLIIPMAGMHYLTYTTLRGMDGIKKQFDLSFSKAPTSKTGEKDYPDEYIKHGARVPAGKSFLGTGVGQKYLDFSGRSESDSVKKDDTKSDADLKAQRDSKPTTDKNDEKKSREKDRVKSFTDWTNAQGAKFSAVTNAIGKRKSEPSDEDLRRIGIPIYDKNHYMGGAVIVFESVTALSAFVRLLNLQSFVNAEQEKLNNSLTFYREFQQVTEQALRVNKPKSRQEMLQERIGKGKPNRKGDTDAQTETLDKPDEGLGEISDDGDAHYVLEGSTFGPTTLHMVVGGLVVSVNFPTEVGAEEAAERINKAYYTAAASFFGLNINSKITKSDLSKLEPYADILGDVSKLVGSDVLTVLLLLGVTPLVIVAEYRLVFRSPPAILGDGRRKLSVSPASGTLDPRLYPGVSIQGKNLKVNAQTALRNLPLELEFVGMPFPVKDGDLLIEVQEYGIPDHEMMRARPAIYEFNDFVIDPLLQNFSPTRCKLIMDVDSLPRQTVDVTGNNGANTLDAGAKILMPPTGVISFPFTLNADNNKFHLEIYGSFVLASNLTEVNGNGLTPSIVREGTDFAALGVKAGDKITIQKLGFPDFTSEILTVDGDTITPRFIFPFSATEGDLTILSIVRGGVPDYLLTETTPLFESDIIVGAQDVSGTTSKTYKLVSELMQDIVLALLGAGVEPGSILPGYVDTSIAQDQTEGYVTLQLSGAWTYSSLVSMRIRKATFTGEAPSLLLNDALTHLPLVLTTANNMFRSEIFDPESPVPTGYQQITLATGAYASLASLASAITAGFVAAGILGVEAVAQSPDIKIFFNAVDGFNVPLATHWSYSAQAGFRIKPLTPITETVMPVDFPVGVALPPVLTFTAPSLPLTVGPNYAEVFNLQVTPVVSSRPSGLTAVSLPQATYTTAAELATGFATGLSAAGFNSGETGFVRVEVSGSNLSLSLRPEASYKTSTASLSLQKTRVSAPVQTGAVVDLPELRDYDYATIYAWLLAHPTTTPTPGFPSTAPQVFLIQNLNATSFTPVYNGNLVVDASNNKFEMQLATPAGGVISGFQVVTVGTGTYASMAALVVGIQSAVNTVFGTGKITVSTFGTERLRFTVVGAGQLGSYATLSLQQNGTSNFLSYGSTTAGALFVSATGTGDRTFTEVTGLADTTVFGSDDFFKSLGLYTGGNYSFLTSGLPVVEGRGTSDYNFLRLIDMVDTQASGSTFQPYTLLQIVTAINAHFLAVDPTYGQLASTNFEQDRLNLTALVQGKRGLLRLIALQDDLIAGSLESSEVAKLLFGYTDPRESQVEVFGLGQTPTCFLLEAELLTPNSYFAEVLDTTAVDLQAELLDPILVAQILSLPPDGYIVEVLSLQN